MRIELVAFNEQKVGLRGFFTNPGHAPDWAGGGARGGVRELRGLGCLAPNGDHPARAVALGLLSEFNQRYDGRKVGLNKQRKRLAELRELGWWVANPRPRKTYSVYVIELDPAVQDRPAAKKANPHADPSMPCVYVGQTSKSPEERFEQHLAGYRCSKWVRKYGLRLLPQLYQRHNPLTELESLWKEDGVAKALRAKGYTVMGGH